MKSALLKKRGWQDEVFQYVGLSFDIMKAEQLIASNPHTPQIAPKAFLEAFVGTIEDDELEQKADSSGTFHINMLQVGLNKSHIDEVDITRPGIVANFSYKPTKRHPTSAPTYILIDGNHRAKKALRTGQEFKVNILTPEETWEVMLKHTPPFLMKNIANPNPKSKPKKKPTTAAYGYGGRDDFFEGEDTSDYKQCIGDYVYDTCCVDSDGDSIVDMVDTAREVSYNLIKKHCEGLRAWEAERSYRKDGHKGLTLRNDYAARFYKSKFRGRPCYFIQWSAIEYVWVLK